MPITHNTYTDIIDNMYQSGARTQPGKTLLGSDIAWKDTTWKDTT